MKKRELHAAIFVVLLVLGSVAAVFAADMIFEVVVGKFIGFKSDLKMLSSEVAMNEPIIFDVSIEINGNLPAYYFLKVTADGKEYWYLVSFLNLKEKVQKKIAVYLPFDKPGNKTISYQIEGTNFREPRSGKLSSSEITVKENNLQLQQDIDLSSDSRLEIGRVNNILLKIKNNRDSGLEDLYLFSPVNGTGTVLIGLIEKGAEDTISLQAYVPKSYKGNYPIKVYAYDSKRKLIASTDFIFETYYGKEEISLSYRVKGKKITAVMKNNLYKIANPDLSMEYYGSLLTFKGKEQLNQYSIMPNENLEIEFSINNSAKIGMKVLDMENTIIQKKTAYIDLKELYFLVGVLILIFIIIFYAKRSAK